MSIDITDPKSIGPVSSDLKPPIGANRVANKAPFTDEELQRVIDACDRMKTIEWSYWQGAGIWTMVYTGLRISDVALFQMKRLRGNEVFLRTKKNGGDVFAYLPDWLRDRLVARAAKRGPRPFLVEQVSRTSEE